VSRARAWLRRVFPRRVRPTRDGWWCLFATLGLGVAALNTGNNLVYLLFAMLLAFILVSGILSELALRRLRLTLVPPGEVYAGRPALFGATLDNGKRWLASYAIGVEVSGPSGRRVLTVARLGAGEERALAWEATLPRRGRQPLPALRLQTRFPFGLAVKSEPAGVGGDVVVFPALRPVSGARLRDAGGAGGSATRRRGRGHDLYSLRAYRAGDDPRLIHWRVTAKAQTLTVRELEEDTALDVRIVLAGGAAGPEPLEAGLSEAASLAVHFLRQGAAVEVAGAGVAVPLGRGRAHELRVLTALALCDPAAAGDGAAPDPGSAGGPRREIRVSLG
jgi:uncharacterized protein (DUF58 family)